jgi:hypothetical protein
MKYDPENGRSMRTNHLSLPAMSVLFFCLPLLTVLNAVLGFLANTTGLDLIPYVSDFSIPAFISLCGGIVFLISTREGNPSWFLGIPLCIAFAITAISSVVSGLLVISNPNPPIYEPGIVWTLLSQAAFCLLPPCAALFFWSQKRLGRWVPVLAGIALVITLCSVAVLYFEFSPYLVSAGFIPPGPPHVENDGFLILYLMFGLPIIGILFLVLAAFWWFTTGRGTPDNSPCPEVQP